MRYIDEVSKLEEVYIKEIEQSVTDGVPEDSSSMKRLRRDFAELQGNLIRLDALAEEVYRKFKL